MSQDLTMDDRGGPEGEEVERQRRRRGRNVALLVALIVWVAIIYAVTIVRMGG